MKNFKKLISLLLTLVMVLGAMTSVFSVSVFAADDTASEGDSEDIPVVEAEKEIDYTTEIYGTPEEKIATMRLALEKEGYQLYVDDYSGEVACVNTNTGEKLFTNPYDVGASTGNAATKYEILSQIIVNFTDTQGQNKIFTSFEEAVLRGQVITEPIKNGLRVEYTIGREQSKTLVPRLISEERFQKMIIEPAYEAFGEELYNMDTMNQEVFDFQRVLEYYVSYDKATITSDRALAAILRDYPVVDRMAVRVFDPTASEAEIAKCEEMILTYCPDYTYEELEYDHALTEYESEDENPPVFRMALEYKIDENGLSVRLPANGIRFNESLYTLNSIEVLPYMGAGNSGYSGYNFFPDGSGALFDFEELNTTQTRSVLGKVYGTDFAYHEITGKYQKTIRYPVFGIVEDSTYYTYTTVDMDTGEVLSENKISGAIVEALKAHNAGEESVVYKGKTGTLATKYNSIINNMDATETKTLEKRGFVAIIEEGDALASLTTYHAGSLSDYNTIKMQFRPRPKDTYNLKDSISVGANSEWTVVSDRKYVGGYKMRYIMLSESDNAAETYDASWFGMAIAYRDYLTEQNVISKIDDSKLTDDIPLYIETFGTVETTEKIMSVPVSVMAPLTTFEDILTMYNELSAQGIKNVNFKLTGYANGGMFYTVPGKLKFEKSVGGNAGFQDLLNEAAKINGEENSKLGIFPDFDFAYMTMDKAFDGYRSSDHAAKTIDDRYANKREYSATQQKYLNYYNIVVSPAYFSEFYNKLASNYVEKYDNVKGISVSSLGYALNSDFDEDEPYNREDSKTFTIKAFEHFDNTYDEVMTDGGNSYVWKYVDHMLDVSLDSSRYNFSSNAVPFIGVVLHGSVSFAGEPLNMEGDLQYAILKAIENGASPYFILSYQNTQALKEYFDLSQYYSIRYDIWKNDIAEVYNVLNDAIGDVQDKYIIGHEFLIGERVPDSDELEADILAEYLARLEAEQNAADILAKEIALSASNARESGRLARDYSAKALTEALEYYKTQMGYASSAIRFSDDYYDEAIKAYEAFEKVRAYAVYASSDDPAEVALYEEYVKADIIVDAVVDYNLRYEDCLAAYDAAYTAYNEKVGSYVVDNSISAIKNNIMSSYSSYANAKTDADREKYLSKIEEYIAEVGQKAIDDYNVYLAAGNARDMVIESFFMLDFEECFEACLAIEETTYYSGNAFKRAATGADPLEDITEKYNAYVAAKKAISSLERKTGNKPTKGSVDNYLSALAQFAVMSKLGYDKSTDESILAAYNNVVAAVSRTRATAVNAVARLDASNLKSIINIYETLAEHVELAIAAIDVLAKTEGDTIEWVDKENLIVANEDELSYVTKQAIENAKLAYSRLMGLNDNTRFEVIEEGRESDVVWNGISLIYNKDANGNKIYKAGSREAGYSYFTLSASGDLEIYHIGAKVGAVVDGLDVYEYTEGNTKYYYTASIETGYTYYEFDSYFSAYIPTTPVVREGEEFATLSDGTVIYLENTVDGQEVYYSVDENGKYTLYEYNMSVKEYTDIAIESMENIKALAAAKTAAGGDDTFSESVQARIDRNNMSRDDGDDDETEEEVSRYQTENIVAVTYGEKMGNPYKSIILNYNNYTVKIVYNGYEYTIPAYEFVVIK